MPGAWEKGMTITSPSRRQLLAARASLTGLSTSPERVGRLPPLTLRVRLTLPLTLSSFPPLLAGRLARGGIRRLGHGAVYGHHIPRRRPRNRRRVQPKRFWGGTRDDVHHSFPVLAVEPVANARPRHGSLLRRPAGVSGTARGRPVAGPLGDERIGQRSRAAGRDTNADVVSPGTQVALVR